MSDDRGGTSTGEHSGTGLSLGAGLAEARQQYRVLVDLCPDPITVHDGTRYVFVNPAAVRLFGASSPGDLVGREVLSLVAPEDREPIAARTRCRRARAGAVSSRQAASAGAHGRPSRAAVFTRVNVRQAKPLGALHPSERT